MSDETCKRCDVVISCLENGVDLIHDVLKDVSIDDELRIKLTKWRAEAEDFIP